MVKKTTTSLIKTPFLLVLVICYALLVACSNSTPESTKTTCTLDFRITWTDYSGRGVAISKIVENYNDEYSDDCTILMIGGDEDQATIEQMLTTSSETILMLPYRYVQYFGDRSLLVDLTDEFSDAETIFYPSIWDLATVDDQTFGIPWLGHSMGLIYNQDLLEAAGVDPLSIVSLESLLAAIEQVESRTEAQGIGLVGADSNDVSWMVNQFIDGFGSSLVNDDGTAVTINNDQSRAALDFYKNVLGPHAQSTWLDDTGTEVMTAFRNQLVAFEIQGIWGVTDIQKNGSPFHTGVIALEDIGLKAEVGPMMLAIPANMSLENQAAAKTFIRYLISKPAQESIMNGEYSIEHDAYYPFRTPIRVDMADSQIFKSYPDYLVFVEGFRNPSIDVPVPAWQTVKEQFYEPGLHRVMTGELAISDFLAQIEIEGNRVLN